MSQVDTEETGADLPPDDDLDAARGRAARLTATRGLRRDVAEAAQPHFSQPVRQVVLMLIVLGLVGAGGWFASGRILPVFFANPLLNGTILVVFAIGVLTCFWQAGQLINSVSWIERFAAGKLGYGAKDGSGKRAPRLLAPLAALLGSRGPTGTTISTESARSILESVATRIDEARDITRYLGNLLIFLGLLGTFYGLATTVPAIVETIRTLAPEQGESGVEVFDKLMHGLETQLGGMATAFSSSLLGLAGSLVVGLLELFASHGQNRFYRELEEWLSSFTRIGLSGGEGGLNEAHLAEFMTLMQGQLGELQDFYARRDELRDLEATDADRRSMVLASGVEKLTTLVGSDRDALATELGAERQAQTESHWRLSEVLERISDQQQRLVDASTDSMTVSSRLQDMATAVERTLARLSDGQDEMIALSRQVPVMQMPDQMTQALADIAEGQRRLALMQSQVPPPAAPREDGAAHFAALGQALNRLADGQDEMIAQARQVPVMQLPDHLSQALSDIADSQQRLALMQPQDGVRVAPREDDGAHIAALGRALNRLADGQARLIELTESKPAPQDDPEARMRLRSIDVQLGRLLEETASGRDGLIAELREDMAALTRALRGLEGRDGA